MSCSPTTASDPADRGHRHDAGADAVAAATAKAAVAAVLRHRRPIPARFNPSLANVAADPGGPSRAMPDFRGRTGSDVIPFDPAARRGRGDAVGYRQRDCPPLRSSTARPVRLEIWTARHDLLESDETDTDFVVEIDSDLIARLRFGDDEYGVCPDRRRDHSPRSIGSATESPAMSGPAVSRMSSSRRSAARCRRAS